MGEQAQSEFNYAFAWLNRINFLFWETNMASKNLDAYGWYMGLLNVYREISTEMKPKYEETAKVLKLKKELLPVVMAWVRSGKNRQAHLNTDLFMQLDEFEILLRKIMDRAGLQTKRADDKIRM